MGVSTGAAFADAETTWYDRWWRADLAVTDGESVGGLEVKRGPPEH